MPQIKETHIDTGQVRYVFKDFPLPFHANAQKAAEASHCAGLQGAYWPMHDRLFEAQAEWSGLDPAQAVDAFVGFATDLGLDGESFRLCLESGQFVEQIEADLKAGQEAGVRGTPSFLVNGQLLVGAYPYETFQQMIEAELEKGP
jgi:protein-disulfide isomerase